MRYPFVKCEHPKRVYNKYTHEPILVGCGKCRSCLCEKADKAALLCAIEESDYKYCVFVTLTYSNDYIPKFKLVDDGNVTYLQNCCTRNGFNTLGVDCCPGVLGFLPEEDRKLYTSTYRQMLQSKCNLNGYFGYCNIRDVQLFLKRFRKNLQKYSYEKIRYYAVAEYGPVHFRPHYHLLLFFSERETFANYRKVIYKSWPFGRVDASISRSKCTSYVSQYLNSVGSLPGLFTLRAVRPFCCHSVGLAQGFYKSKAKEVYKNGFAAFMRACRPIGSKYVSFRPWRALKTAFYPRCAEYNCKSVSELYYSYTILLQAIRKYGGKSITQLTKDIVNDVRNDEKLIYYDVYGHLNNSNCSKDLLIKYFRVASCDDSSLPSRVSSELYLSKHFLTFCVPNMFPNEDYNSSFVLHKAVNKIIDFYNFCDLDNLGSMYESMNDYYDEYKDKIGYCFFYNNFPLVFFDPENQPKFGYYNSFDLPFEHDMFLRSLGWTAESINELDLFDFRKLPIVQEFINKNVEKYDKHMKHKRLNDLNNIFCLSDSKVIV